MIRFAKLVRTAASTARRVLTAQLRGLGASGADATAENIDGADAGAGGAEIVQPLGLVARPVLTEHTEALVVELRDGDEVIAIAVVDKSRAALTVEEGGVRLVGAGPNNTTAAGVYIRAAGALELTSEAGQDIRLNTSTGAAVGRVGDAVDAGATPTTGMAAWISLVSAAINAIAPGTIPPGVPSDFGTIAAGAPRVKA